MIMSPRIRRYFMLGISIFASLSSQVKFDNRGNILEARRRTFSIKSSSFFSSGYQTVTQYSRWGRIREINKYLNETMSRKLYDFRIRPINTDDSRIELVRYYLPTAKVKDYNIMIDGKNFFDLPIKSYIKTYENIRKIATGQGDDYTTGCLTIIISKTIMR